MEPQRRPEDRWQRGTVGDDLAGALYRSPLIESTIDRALFRLPAVGRFLIRPGAPPIVDPEPGTTDEDVECFVQGTVAALGALLDRQFVLRGAAVEIAGQALVVCGAVAGTSTMAAALAHRGHGVIADGSVLIDGNLLVWSVPPDEPPDITLWPDAIAELGIDLAAGRTVRPALSSRRFRLGPPRPPQGVRLAAVVFLGVDGRLGGADPLVEVDDLKGGRRMSALVEAMWHPRMVGPLGMAREQFEWLGGVASGSLLAVFRRAAGPFGPVLAELVDRAEGLVG